MAENSASVGDVSEILTEISASVGDVSPSWADCVSNIAPAHITLMRDVILETVKPGIRMDTDSLNFAIEKMASEKPSHGYLNSYIPVCRKQYISADFAMCVISEEADDSNVQTFIDNGLVRLIGLNVEVICIPVIHVEHWTLYAFNMKEHKLSILDSARNPSLHEGIPSKIYQALVRTNAANEMFKNMKDFEDWVCEFPEVRQQRNNFDCGFFVFNFMRYWDGYKLVDLITDNSEEMREEFRAYCNDEAYFPLKEATIHSTKAPLYKVAPVTKIIVEPCKTLKSPFLVKRQFFCRPDAEKMKYLYDYTINNTFPNIHWMGDIQELMKNIEISMNTSCLNLAISSMESEDAHDFKDTMCLGWRHYVNSNWAVKSLNGCSNPVDLKTLFYQGSVLYNASQSHLVLIPVVIHHHDHNRYWSLYVFNMSDQKLSILDSLPDDTKDYDDPMVRHQKIRCNLCDALTKTMDFAIDFRSWDYKFPKVPRHLNRYDSGFFVFNFMRLWDGHDLVRWFPTESMELRKDFLAYILSCKVKSVNLPHEVSLKMEELPGKMMDCVLQKVARYGAKLCTENQGEHGGAGSSNNAPCDHAINMPEAPTESSNALDNAHASSSRETPAASSALDHTVAYSDFLSTHQRVTSDGDGVLHIAARFKNKELVCDILENHADLAKVLLLAVNNRGDTPVHSAAAGGSKDIVGLFLLLKFESGAVTDEVIGKLLMAQNLKGETCLHEAVRHGHLDIVQILIKTAPPVVKIVDNEGVSPLYLATTLRWTKIVSILTTMSYDEVSCKGPKGKTALHAAVVLLDKKLSENLLVWNASLISQGDESGSTPLHFLASLYLRRREFNIFSKVLGIRKYIMNEDPGILKLIMDKDPLSPLYTDSMGSLPIHIAAAHGRLHTVVKLLEECPYCDSSRNASGQTFLHVAVKSEKLEIVRYVCREKEFNRILNAVDQDGNTALHLAVLNASEDALNNASEASINNTSERIFCTLMQNSDVCLNFANKEGHTPLDLAFLSLHPKVISMKGPRERIFFDLLHGGGDFGVYCWDQLAGDIVNPDWEKESERVGKSASLQAVCAVLILNAALLAPFSLIGKKDKDEINFNGFYFQAFVIFDSIAFISSAAAAFFYARAGFAMSDASTRLKNLITGTHALYFAAPTLLFTVAAALILVLPEATAFVPIIFAGLFGLLPLLKHKAAYMLAHLKAIWSRVGILQLIRILLFQRTAVKPHRMFPSVSINLFWPIASVLVMLVSQRILGGM